MPRHINKLIKKDKYENNIPGNGLAQVRHIRAPVQISP